jgi:hypothetical protein
MRGRIVGTPRPLKQPGGRPSRTSGQARPEHASGLDVRDRKAISRVLERIHRPHVHTREQDAGTVSIRKWDKDEIDLASLAIH